MSSWLVIFCLSLATLPFIVPVIVLANRDKQQMAKGEFSKDRATTVECVIAYLAGIICVCAAFNYLWYGWVIITGGKNALINPFFSTLYFIVFAVVLTSVPAAVAAKCFSAHGKVGLRNCMIGGVLASVIPFVFIMFFLSDGVFNFGLFFAFLSLGACGGFIYWWVRRRLMTRRLLNIS